jgi:hypothetical protein
MASVCPILTVRPCKPCPWILALAAAYGANEHEALSATVVGLSHTPDVPESVSGNRVHRSEGTVRARHVLQVCSRGTSRLHAASTTTA